MYKTEYYSYLHPIPGADRNRVDRICRRRVAKSTSVLRSIVERSRLTFSAFLYKRRPQSQTGLISQNISALTCYQISNRYKKCTKIQVIANLGHLSALLSSLFSMTSPNLTPNENNTSMRPLRDVQTLPELSRARKCLEHQRV